MLASSFVAEVTIQLEADDTTGRHLAHADLVASVAVQLITICVLIHEVDHDGLLVAEWRVAFRRWWQHTRSAIQGRLELRVPGTLVVWEAQRILEEASHGRG